MPPLPLPPLRRFLAAWFCLGLALAPALVLAQPTPAAKGDKKYVAYKLSRGDTISVSVLGESDLSVTQKRIEATGTVNLPLIQSILLHGLTIGEAQDSIAKAYREGRFLRNPVITVTVEVYAPRTVIVTGKVGNPGRQEIPADVEFTLKDLIGKVGGFGDTAKGTAVKVTRTMPDGSTKSFILDVESALKGKGNPADANFVLEPDDIIYVPERVI